MSRFFGGFGGAGSGGNRFGGGSSGSKPDARSALDRAIASKDRMQSLKKKGTESNDERYQKLVQEKMEKQKSMLMADKKMNSAFHLPGTKMEEKEVSKSTQMALEMMAAKMAKKELKSKKKSEDGLIIKPTHIGYHGYLDKKGKIYNNEGKTMMKIDKQTGAITTTGMFAKKIGTYDPDSSYCLFKIGKQLEKEAQKRGKGANPSSIYGTTSSDDSASGSIWGTPGAGSIWGTTDDDDKGNGWW